MKKALVIFHDDGSTRPAVKIVCQALQKYGIEYKLKNRQTISRRSFQGKDLAITIGGDGTFLRASHFNLNVPMLGLNADPLKKEGEVTRTNAKKFEQDLKRFLENPNIIDLIRLECRINGKKTNEFALNDIFIGRKKAYRLFTYELNREHQRSSGLVISTPIGSSAWAKSAGGEVLNYRKDKRFEVVVREPYVGRLNRTPSQVSKLYGSNEKVKICCMSQDGIVVFDSLGFEHNLKPDDVVEVYVSNRPLKFVET